MTSTPTKSIRLSVPVTPEVQATFQRLAEVSGRSMAASLSQWLSDTKDAADLMAQNLERLRESPGELVMKVKLHTSAVEDAAEHAIEEAMRLADETEFNPAGGSRLSGSAGRVVRSSGGQKGPVLPLTPPSSNTGGKVHGRGKSRGA